MQEKYGVDFAGQSAFLNEKRNSTMKERYGVISPAQRGKNQKNIDILNDKQAFENFVITFQGEKTYEQIAKILGYSKSAIEKRAIEWNIQNLFFHNQYESAPERELKEMLQNWGWKPIKSSKIIPPYEIDLYIPELKKGIEFNGDWFHQVEKKGKRYHQIKSIKALQKGVFIYHIFEHEWLDFQKRREIEEDLQRLFGPKEALFYIECKKYSNKIESFSQNQKIGEIVFQLVDGFFSLTSWWTSARFEEDKIIKEMFDKMPKGEYRLECDLSKESGQLWINLGFKFLKHTTPQIKWIYHNKEIFPSTEEEKELIKRGLFQICDCGTKILTCKKEY